MAGWRTLESRRVLDHPVLRVEVMRREREAGREGEFVVLSSPDWVNVVPVTPEGQVVLIRQWRHGTQAETLEIPGGIVDPGETPRQAGVRELAEETGYAPGEVEDLGWVETNPAILTNSCHTLLALGCRPAGPQRLEDGEDISLELHDLDELPALVTSGRIRHSLVVAAFSLLWLKRPGLAPALQL